MINQRRELIKSQIKTHSERSVEDFAAVSTLESFLKSDGRINTNFAANDKWPNHDGTFEFISNPIADRRPEQTFYVQIKGTQNYIEQDGIIKYTLHSLAFPAFMCNQVTFDPGILFVVLNPKERGHERVFWKYMSESFLNSIDYEKNSMTITFKDKDEIFDTDESVVGFSKQLEIISDRHSFLNQLSAREYSRSDIEKIIYRCNKKIEENIEEIDESGINRNEISERMLTSLKDLCSATLLLNAIQEGYPNANLKLAWECSILNIKTRYLGTFLKGLYYVGMCVPEDGQSERLMLKYYDFLWQIRKTLKEQYKIEILNNLEKFIVNRDEIDNRYYKLVSDAIESSYTSQNIFHTNRYYIHKKTPFFVGKERYYEVTLQLAGVYASKYNRITAYTKEDISTNYTIKIGYVEKNINLWDVDIHIKLITTWGVSIDPTCLNKLSKIINIPKKLTSKYQEYNKLMGFLTYTGANLLELIDLEEFEFSKILENIYKETNTDLYKDVIYYLREHYSKNKMEFGSNTIRYLLYELREETLNNIMIKASTDKRLSNHLNITTRCYPFEKNPFISNLSGTKSSSGSHINRIFNVAGKKYLQLSRPYLHIRNQIKQTGEIYYDLSSLNLSKESVMEYNGNLDNWELNHGYKINIEDNRVCIESYERSTLLILKKLLEFSKQENKGQKEYNAKFLKDGLNDTQDDRKKQAIKEAFVKSRLLLIYGAAGTGKTRLINYISNLMKDRKKLFLTKTHTALQNLYRRIENPGTDSDFTSIDSFTKKVNLNDYDVIFIDECSTIDNLTMMKFLAKIKKDTFLVMAGDIHQIESIDFGNWFFYAKDIITTPGSNVELLSTWRTQDHNLINLWNEVRNKRELITEKLVIDGPFSEDIGPNIFKPIKSDEVILCLNYDGKFGLNNINNYLQAANSQSEAVTWEEWAYKIGDKILFNDTERFPILYNNLKGKIVDIKKEQNEISFTVDVGISLTEADCKKYELEFIDAHENFTRIRFTVYSYDTTKYEDIDDDMRRKSVIPFQLAYAVSIHKAQGLEYDSVKLIIPSNNVEKITHGVFYTAITRAKTDLKIFWSSETMNDVIKGFSTSDTDVTSLSVVKSKLAADKLLI